MHPSTLSLHPGPGAGFDEPFEMLQACHQRVQRMLDLLQRLEAHLTAQGCDANAGQAARDVMRYFDLAGPAHHEDEERHVFPPLLATADAATVVRVRQLQQEHVEMDTQWQAVRADLQAVADGHWPPPDPAGTAARWAGFAALYARHIDAEEGAVYPVARALLDAATLRAMGDEMAVRRGARR